MEAISNIGSRFSGNLSNVINTGEVLNVRFYSPRIKNTSNNKRRFSLVIASNYYHGSPQKVDTINGIKVNGIRVAEAPLAAGKSPNESKSDAVLVTNGRFVEGRFVYRQIFVIRSYEIGPDKTATMETLMNFLQVISFTIKQLIFLVSTCNMPITKCIMSTEIIEIILGNLFWLLQLSLLHHQIQNHGLMIAYEGQHHLSPIMIIYNNIASLYDTNKYILIISNAIGIVQQS